LDDLRRRLTRLETALAEQQRDAGVVVARGSSRGADVREEGARMNADAKRRETEETEHLSTTPASSSSGWRAAWRRARRFASRFSFSRREGSEEE
jgi:DNA-binding helix-hairpin-helix protein with protein kinase domain